MVGTLHLTPSRMLASVTRRSIQPGASTVGLQATASGRFEAVRLDNSRTEPELASTTSAIAELVTTTMFSWAWLVTRIITMGIHIDMVIRATRTHRITIPRIVTGFTDARISPF